MIEKPIHIHLGKDRRIAVPAHFCKQANLQPGDHFLMSRVGKQLVLTPLADEAEKMRQDLRALLGDGVNLSDDLRALRAVDRDDEVRHR